MQKVPDQMTERDARYKAQVEAARERMAALRPKLTKAEAEKRRSALLRRMRVIDIVSFVILGAVLAWLGTQLFEAAKPEAENEAVLGVMLYYWGAIALHGALLLRCGFVRLSAANMVSEDRTDHPFKGIRLSWYSPVLGMAILLPAIFAGLFNGDDTGTVASFFMMFLMILVAYLMSALVAAFIILPIELLLRGLYALLRGDKTRSHYAVSGLVIAAIAASALLAPFAIDPDGSSGRGGVQYIQALIGVPGAYDVISEPLLWVARGIVLGLVVFFVWLWLSGKRRA